MRPQRPAFHHLVTQRREELMEKAVKREARDLSLAYVKFQPLPISFRQDQPLLESVIEDTKRQVIIEALNELILIRGCEHTLIRSFDVRDWEDTGLSQYKGLMMLVLFGWAYPTDNEDLRGGGLNTGNSASR